MDDVVSMTCAPRASDNRLSVSGCSEVTEVPSGRMILTAGSLPSVLGELTNDARKSKSFPHLRGFFALATFPVTLSTSA